jgi:TRAP-type mannitol/chloroaromatic compound transport system permease large subunit
MNRLERKAWFELVGVAGCVLVTGVCLAFMVRSNAKGLDTLLIGAGAGLVAGLIAYLRLISAEAKLDEREKEILRKAFIWASRTLTLVWGASAFIVFFTVGGKGVVPVYVLPMTFLAGLFMAQFVQSAMVLIQCTKEQNEQ